MLYGASRLGPHRPAAALVDEVLTGARPGDLSIERPTTVDFIVSPNTARALGPTILSRATELIQ